MAIIRIPQLKVLKYAINHDFVCEIFKDDDWHYLKTPCYFLKNAKVRFHENIVFLVGYTFTDDKEKVKYQEQFFTDSTIDWNDDVSQYAFVEWVDFFEAYY